MKNKILNKELMVMNSTPLFIVDKTKTKDQENWASYQ